MKKTLLTCALAMVAGMSAVAQVQTEYLNRGVVAVPTDKGVFVSWRSLASDEKNMVFDVYRDGVKITDTPVAAGTNITDAAGKAGSKYEVRAIVGAETKDTGEAVAWDQPYMRIHLDRPAGGKSPAGGANEQRDYTYTPDDISVGDIDGDGQYELFVKWHPTNAADNSFYRYTGNTYIDCYRLDGTKLWRIDLGRNIRSGNHYTQFMVYDFDGDGKAEMICKTAPGTIDGAGNAVLMGSDKETDDYRNSQGHILSGPEYLTVFSGATGAAINTIAYNPPRSIRKFDKSSTGWGDSYGGRSERYLAGVAYLDGKHPSAVMCRGYYTAAYLWAVDFDGKQLKEVWLHKSETSGKGAYGEGAHSLTVGDVDGDGCDEIVYGAACIDHDGSLLYRTGAGHGDALHLADMLPEREGLEVFMPHEEKSAQYKWDTELRDARTGEILFGKNQSGNDIGRGLAANISQQWSGYEYWAASDNTVYNSGMAVSTKRPSINFRIYWDGDVLDELLDGTKITKPNAAVTSIPALVDFSEYSNAASCNSTKATPNLQADLLGDWREEVILHDGSTESDLLVFTTSIPTDYKVTCLMQDHQYRMAIAWQNVAYNQPPHLSYNLEEYFNRGAKFTVNSGATAQLVNLGEAMTPVEIKVARATGAKAENLPDGVTFDFDATTLTGSLSGTPAEVGEYTITIVTTGNQYEEEATLRVNLKVRRSEMLVPVASFSFDTPDGTNGAGLDASVTGTLVAASDAQKGGAAKFDGSSYLVQSADPQMALGGGDFSIEFWMRSEDTAAYLFHKGSITRNESTGATGNWMGLELKNGNVTFAIDDDVTKSQVQLKDYGKSLFDGNWHHVVLVRDIYAKTLSFYVDGTLEGDAEDATGALGFADENFVIGNVNVNFDNAYTGDLDEFVVYKGAMTAAKVAEHYNTIGRELAYFPMDEIGSTTPNLVYGEAEAIGGIPVLVNGLKGGAVEFADGGYFSQPAYDAIQLAERPFTVELWMKSTDDNGYIFFKGSHKNDGQNTSGNWIGLERKGGYLCFSIDDDVAKTDCKLADASAVFDGGWHHIACVRDFEAKTLTLYVDGVAVATASGVKTGGINDLMEPLLIGCSDETDRPFEGVVDEFIIHPSAMTADDVAASYASLRDAISGIDDIEISVSARYTIVNAMSGIIVRSAIGTSSEEIVDNLERGVYILVIEDGKTTKTYKFAVR